ncbi:response regulator transcription factor [Paenibacillus sp. J22TS3]|uniref:response regulator transcription factor n=1 Tax=Paenibacillus sp. J22TS3 TaxID=2807192 RepID=UPI001B135006|nr:response regulator transcription factor [Paenibacillus sp. J22TS3]GIP23943.1 DNA-binding response regulator [Paenibacillus sp. J22TS3]
MFTVLIIEDDSKLTEMLRSHIEKYEYRTVIVTDFNRVMDTFHETKPSLVLLDVNLPSYDGFYWCRQIRSVSNCPIIFISARESQMDQVMALENGADDYITKPFHYEVVMAKIRSQLRRAYGAYSTAQEERTVILDGLVLYPERLLMELSGRRVELTHKEALLMELLMQRKGRVVSRDKLLDRMWEDQHFIDDNTLNVYITRIRKKLKELGAGEAIETVRGAGYMLRPLWVEEP